MKYRNPVLCQDFPDPDVIRVGEDYYMVSSSFNYSPALPVLRSEDLVGWSYVGHVAARLPERFRDVRPGEGVWAPAIRRRAGIFYCVFPLYGEGIYMCETTDIEGEWSKPRLILEGEGLEDPCPVWTDDGRAYMAVAYAKSKAGFNSRIDVCEMSRDLKERFSGFRTVYDGTIENPVIEGPKFYRRGGYFYILAPAGGVKSGWQVALRSRDVYGPYESRRILEEGESGVRGPHQGALVDTPSGDWFFVHFSDMDAYGRVTCLEPVSWIDDWPIPGYVTKDTSAGEVIGVPVKEWPIPAGGDAACAREVAGDKIARGGAVCAAESSAPEGEAVRGAATRADSEREDCFSREQAVLWETPAVCEDGWCEARDGLILHARRRDGSLASFPYVLTRRFPAFAFTVRTRVDANALTEGRAGLCVLGKITMSLNIVAARESASAATSPPAAEKGVEAGVETDVETGVETDVETDVETGIEIVAAAAKANAPKRGFVAELRFERACEDGELLLSRPIDGMSAELSLSCRPEKTLSGFAAKCRFFLNGSEFGEEFSASEGVWTGARIGLFAKGDGDAKFEFFVAETDDTFPE